MKADRILELWKDSLKQALFADVWKYWTCKLVRKRVPVVVRKTNN